ncbi:hypothetical protein [Bacillus sp. B-jedd]|uniref:hypothetical protein n=1 Tax=Bacillus sp. B-jedd TaxID=1476857 RepID=UPI0006627A40|nr:hypothetical protein [Bacillus sp. B-jedd]
MRKELQDYKKINREEIKELEKEIERAGRTTDTLNITMAYVKDTVSEVKEMMNSFIGVVNEQNKKIDDFINSDKRRESRKQLTVSVLQVLSGIVIAVLGIYAGFKL